MCSQARPGGVSRRRGGESTPITPHRTRIVPHARLVYGAILRSAQTRDAVRIRSRHYSGEDSALPATLLWSTGQDQVERAAPTLAEEVGPRDEPSGLGRKFGLALRAVRHVLAEDARGPAGDAALTTCGGGTSLIRGAGNRLGAPPSRAPSMSPSARRVITKKSRACRRSCPSGWPGECYTRPMAEELKPDAPIGDHGAVELGGVRVAVHVARVTPAAYLPVPTVLACARRPRTRTDTALTRTAGAPRARRARASMLPAVQQQGRQPQAGQGVSQGRRHGLGLWWGAEGRSQAASVLSASSSTRRLSSTSWPSFLTARARC